MFGSKNNQQKTRTEISIETMEGNLKGENERPLSVEYNEKSQEKISTESANAPTTTNIPNSKDNSINEDTKPIFQAPFKNDLATSEKDIVSEKGIFTKTIKTPEIPNKTKTEELSLSDDIQNAKIPQITGNTSGKNNSAFLHQAIDKKMEDNKENSSRQFNKIATEEKKGISSIIFIIIFILLLAGIMYGGYYFYMHQGEKKSKQQNSEQVNKTSAEEKNINNKTTESAKKIPAKIPQKPIPVKYKIGPLVTSPTTFNNDLGKFVLEIKQKGDKTELQNGVLVDVIKKDKTALSSKELLEAIHMTDFFKPTDLKNTCKLFVIEDSGKIRVGTVFELSNTADEKIVKEKIIEKENDLIQKMSYLFVDRDKPIVPTEVKFNVNPVNMGARYANYSPGVDTASVDWNILDLGKGKIVYFVTSKKSAKTLTDYLMRSVVK